MLLSLVLPWLHSTHSIGKGCFGFFITQLPRRLIQLNWKSPPTYPSHTHLIGDTLHCLKLGRKKKREINVTG